MPNQLATSKRRQSLAEHGAVLAALAAIARRERTTVMALLREAARDAVRKRTADPRLAGSLRPVVMGLAPECPTRFKTRAQLARFKRAQREFDKAVMDMNLASPASIQDRNSIAAPNSAIELIDFDTAHAPAPV